MLGGRDVHGASNLECLYSYIEEAGASVWAFTEVNPDIGSRMALFRAVARLLPEHPLRQKRAQIAAAVAAKQLEKKASKEAAAASKGGSSKKKGKKGRK